MTTRRNFIKTTGAAMGAAALISPISLLNGQAGNRSLSFGFQTWTLRDQLGEDLPGTLKMMADLGYKEVEFCSPLGYKGTPFEKFNDMSGKELRKIIEDNGLICESSHYNFGEMKDSLENRIEWSHEMGITQIICSSFWLGDEATLDDYKKSCEVLNKIGEKTKAAGIVTGFHNHHMEFEKLDDKLIYDVLLEELDPEIVKMQFQVAVANIGYNAADYFRNHPGRFISAHLSDWSAELEKQVPVGQGIVDWPDFFKAAKVGGVKNFYVEMAPSTFAESAEFLKTV